MRFAEFWPIYLRLHAHPGNRALHMAGTAGAFVLLIGSVALARPLLVLAALCVGYGAAWSGHILVERNRPATFGHPMLSLMADFKMLALFASGRLNAEIARTRRKN